MTSAATPGPLSLGVQIPQSAAWGLGEGVSCSSESPAGPAPGPRRVHPGPRKGMREESRGLWGERRSVPHPSTSVLRDPEVPEEVGRGPGVGAGSSGDAAGTRTLAQQCRVCHHQRLLLFPAPFLTDSKVKSKT